MTGLLIWLSLGACLAYAGHRRNRWLQGLGVVIMMAAPWLLGILSTPGFAALGLAAGLRRGYVISLPLAIWFWIGGAFLYASTLGFMATDIYAEGDAPRLLLIWLGLGLLLAARAGHQPLLLAWLLGLFLRWQGLLDSANLWNMMLDPLSLIAVVFFRYQVRTHHKHRNGSFKPF